MQNLLFLAHRIPYPPNKGDKIRSWNLLRRLADDYNVHVGSFVDDPHDWQFTETVAKISASSCFLPLGRRAGLLRSLTGLATGAPLTVGYYRDRRLRQWVGALAENTRIDRVFVFSSSMLQYVPRQLADDARVVVDFVDVDSDKWRQYADKKSWPVSAIYRREARTLLGVEQAGAASVDASTFVSEDEAALFRDLAPDAAERVFGLTNGVDGDIFDPSIASDPPFDPAAANIVFTGAMDYWANVDAVCWFADDILPRIRAKSPDAHFWVVGAHPAADVQRIGGLPGVTVTGRVEDVRPYIRHAAVSVAPLRVARGIQNKVLEAMAMEKATVVTPEAIEGIEAEIGTDVLVAQGATDFADRVTGLLTGGDAAVIGAAARKQVLRAHGWPASYQKLVSILEGHAAT